MGLFSWLFGKKTNSKENNKFETTGVLGDLKAADQLGNTDDVIQRHSERLGINTNDIDLALDEETQDLLDDLELKFSENTRNQQILDLSDKQREAMIANKHDLNHQLKICRRAIAKGSILPFPFERAVILLTKEKRYKEALEICEYTLWWCGDAKQGYDGWSAEHFNSPVLRKIVERIPKLKSKLG